MSNQNFSQPPPNRDWVRQEPMEQKKRPTASTLLFVSVIALMTAALFLSLMTRPTEAEAEPAPTVTVTATETIEPEPAPTVTKTVEAAVSQACKDAIADGDQILASAQEVSGLIAGHFDADSVLFGELAEFDYSGMDAYTEHVNQFTADITRLTAELDGNQWGINATLCLS